MSYFQHELSGQPRFRTSPVSRAALALVMACAAWPLAAQTTAPTTAQSPEQMTTAQADAAQKATPEADATLEAVSVVGDWLADASEEDVFAHPGARDVLRREEFTREGIVTVREALNRIPGVNAPENNGTGSHDMALNFGVRGLNPRLASRSTVLMDGIPVPFAPYGQPQLSFGAVTMGNVDALDVVRGGGAVRYGPQNVGGIVNFVTRAIPEKFGVKAGLQLDTSPGSSSKGPKGSANFLVGGTNARGLGAALLYSGTRGSDFREHSSTQIDDVILKGQLKLAPGHRLHALVQHYEGKADMPGGLSRAQFNADPYQSTRPLDRFWGRRTVASAGYEYSQGARRLSVQAFHTNTLRSGYLDQGKFVSLSPRYYWVRGVQAHASQGMRLGSTRHEIGLGWRYINEASHELRYRENTPITRLPGTDSRKDRDTRGQTRAHAFYIDDRIDIGRLTLTPGLRYEHIKQQQTNVLTARPYAGNYNVALPALNVSYWLDDRWTLYANTEGSFGSVQYSQMPNRVAQNKIEPEKARTWEIGTRYASKHLQAEANIFLINFSNQYESNQTTGNVIARGKTRHQGVETSVLYRLDALSPALAGLDVRLNYAYTDASIREAGPNQGNAVPFSSRHKGLIALNYARDAWRVGLEGQFQSSQYADNANTRAETARGNAGRIPGYAIWHLRAGYDFGPAAAGMKLSLGVKNLFDRAYYTRSFDDNNMGLYLGQPRTYYVQASFDF